MKFISIRILFVAIALLTLSTNASAQAAARRNPQQQDLNEPFDTLTREQFSYYIGLAQGNGLKPYLAQTLGMDTALYMDEFVSAVKQRFQSPGNGMLTAFSAGLQVGEQVQSQFAPDLDRRITGSEDSSFIDMDLYRQGFLDFLEGNELPVSVDSAAKVATYQLRYYQAQLLEQQYGDNRRIGAEFLSENAKNDSVVCLPSGVQYKILTQGTGQKPTSTSTVKVNYEGRLIDGTVFDSSYTRGKTSSFKVTGVIKGWTEVLQLMPVGSIWEVYIPQELAYGDKQQAKIPPYSTLIFKIELLDIEQAKKK